MSVAILAQASRRGQIVLGAHFMDPSDEMFDEMFPDLEEGELPEEAAAEVLAEDEQPILAYPMPILRLCLSCALSVDVGPLGCTTADAPQLAEYSMFFHTSTRQVDMIICCCGATRMQHSLPHTLYRVTRVREKLIVLSVAVGPLGCTTAESP